MKLRSLFYSTYKKEVLAAMNEVLSQYLNKTHSLQYSSCPLCEKYNNLKSFRKCQGCPMNVFRNSVNEIGCLSRKCAPVDFVRPFTTKYCDKYLGLQLNINEHHIASSNGMTRLAAVIEFYRRAIAAIENTPSKHLNFSSDFVFLINIDNEVAEKYNLVRTVF